MTKRLILVIAMIACVHGSFLRAQRFGGNPPSVKWRQFDTDTVRVIFPAGLEREGSRVVDISHLLNRTTGATIGSSSKKIDIVLQDKPTISNAYVGLAPWRSEFYLTPLQNSMQLGSLPWVDKLAVHEYRHVQQFMNFRKGLSKLAWVIAGQEGQALANGAAVPDWFFEGDAVFQETLVSRQGRGRLPFFFNGYRSLWQDGRNYSYMKLRNGSLKDYVPDHYQLGYQLVAYGRKTYGDDFWRKVTEDAVRFRPFFYPFQGAVKRHAGVGFRTFVDKALESFRVAAPTWEDEVNGRYITKNVERNVTEYHLPYILGKDSVLALKTDYRRIPSWQLITPDGERRIAVKDIGIDDHFGYGNGRIVYSDYRPDIRWAWKEYGGITILDIRSGQRRRIAKGTRYFSPNLSWQGDRIVAVHVAPGGKASLHVLDAENGNRIRTLENPDNLFFSHPVFSRDESEVVAATRNASGQMALAAFRIADGNMRILVPWSDRPIAFPRVAGDRIVFTASHMQKDQLFSVDQGSGEIGLLTGHYTGSYGAVADTMQGDLVYSRFTSTGYGLYRTDMPRPAILPAEEWRRAPNPPIADRVLTSVNGYLIEQAPKVEAVAGPYRKGSRLVNIHSWRPWYEQPLWTFSLYGQNILNTFRSEFYYQYNENEGYHKTGFNGTYSGWYPWVTAGVSQTFNRYFSSGTAAGGSQTTYRWNEWNANAGLRLPLNLSGGLHFRSLVFSAALHDQRINYRQTASGKPDDRRFNYLQGGIAWQMQNQQAVRHIFPRFAHALTADYRVAVGGTTARQVHAGGALYLPGILQTHNLVLNGSFQARDTLRQYIFTNNFALARGYTALNYPRMWKWGVNYHFTIACPDAGIAQLVYLLRLRANVFFDASYVKSLRMGTITPFRSVGAELYFDTKWWNQQSVSFGIRYARLLDAEKLPQPAGSRNHWAFIVPLDLLSN